MASSPSSPPSGDTGGDHRRRLEGQGGRGRRAGAPARAPAGGRAAGGRRCRQRPPGPELSPRGPRGSPRAAARRAVARRHSFNRGVRGELRVAASAGTRVRPLFYEPRVRLGGWPASPSKSLRDALAFLRKRASRLLPSSSRGVSGCKCSRGSCRQESASSPSFARDNRRASLCDGLCTTKSSRWSGSDRSAPLLGTRALRGRGTTPRTPRRAPRLGCAGGASEAAFAPKSLERSSSDRNASAGKLSSLASSALFWESASTRWCEVTLHQPSQRASRYAPSSKLYKVVRVVSSRLHRQEGRADCRTWR